MDRFLGKRNRNAGSRRSAGSTSMDPVKAAEAQLQQEQAKEEDLNGLFELWPLRSPETLESPTKLDIVAIHGLNGDPYRTWTDGYRFWLQDFLPSDIPAARIFTYGYNSGVAFSGSASRVDDYARTLLARLRAKRREFPSDEKRPIIFICHSLGGIVLKKALIIAHERSEVYSSISRDTFGVMFMGTPHRGSDAAFWSHIFGSMADLLTLGSIRTQLLQDLKPKSDCLGSICSQFVERAQSLRIFTMYERLRIKGLPGLVVDEHSAVMNLPNEIPIPIEADHRDMCRFTNKDSEKYRMVYDCLKELVDDALEMEQPYDTPVRSEFLLSLKRFEPDEVLRRVPRSSPGTCTWITTNDKFKEWRDVPKNRVLWISGIPGIGKTTAMRYLIENLRRWLQRQEETKGSISTVAFFFCNSNDWLHNNQTQLLSSLLYQILSQNKQSFRYLNESDLKEYVLRIKDDPSDCSDEGLEILWKSLSTILQRSNDLTFWIFIDAIDELTSESRKVFVRQMGQAIDQDLSQKVKLVFSDRVHPNSRGLKRTTVSLEMQSRTEIADDVRRFISNQVEDLCTNGTIPWRYQTQIEETFLDLSEGNFLQASLAWSNFSSGVSYWSPQVINNRLESVRKISKEATSYYCSLLERIPQDSQEIAKVGFTWVLGSRKPLNVSELQHAVAISAGQSSWADLVESLGFNFEVQFDTAFGYLLRVEPDRNVRFAHSTVKELLTSPPAELSSKNAAVLSKFRIQKSDIDAELAKRCIIILSFRDFVRLRDIAQETLSDRIKDFLVSSLQSEEGLIRFDFGKYDDDEEVVGDPTRGSELNTKFRELKRSLSRTNLGQDNHTLLSYCVSYWNYHCGQGGSDPEVVESLSRFVLLRQSHFFHLVAMLLGMARVHRGYIWKNVNQFERLPPLQFVMRVGDHPSVVQNLISQGQRINSMDCHGWTALGWAILEDRRDALEVLLSQDSIRLDRLDPATEGPLHLACRSGASTEIIQRLLDDPRTNVNTRSLEGWTILHWCLSRETLHKIVYSLLQRKDLDINTPDGNGTTYLDQVFQDGMSEDIALRIISRWDVPSNWFERTPKRSYKVMNEDRPPMSYLQMASFLQWYEIEDLILKLKPSKALEVEIDGVNLLERYAFHGVEHRLLRVLEELPQNIFEGNKEQSTKLMHLCAQQDWELTVQELRRKFNIEDEHLETDEYGRTLAHWACELHWKSIDSLIREKPSSWVNHAANDGKTALHVAVEHRNQFACESLLKAGANYLAKDKSNKLPIHIAAEQGHRSIVLLLLERPIRDYGKDLQGRDLLHFLVMWHSDAFIRLCLGILRPRMDVLDQRRRSPLHYAAIFGNSAAVKVLLEIGADANLKDSLGSTPVHYALSSGSLKSFQLMRNSGADLGMMDKFQRNTLHLAIRSENSELIEHILKIMRSEPKSIQQNVRHVDTFGQTVLHRCCLWDTLQSRSTEVSEDEDDILELDQNLDENTGHSYSNPKFTKTGKHIRALRNLGANVNARDNLGLTPLHTASKFSNAVAAEVLLSFSETKPSIKDKKGRTPLDFAVVDEQNRIADALWKRGAEHSANWQSKVRPLYVPWREDWVSSKGWMLMVPGGIYKQYSGKDIT